MNLVSTLFKVAREFSPETSNEEIEKVQRKAEAQVVRYTKEDKGVKGMYAKAHDGWIFPLLLVFGAPFLTAWLIKKKGELLSSSSPSLDRFDDYEMLDDEESDLEEFYRLKDKYEPEE